MPLTLFPLSGQCGSEQPSAAIRLRIPIGERRLDLLVKLNLGPMTLGGLAACVTSPDAHPATVCTSHDADLFLPPATAHIWLYWCWFHQPLGCSTPWGGSLGLGDGAAVTHVLEFTDNILVFYAVAKVVFRVV